MSRLASAFMCKTSLFHVDSGQWTLRLVRLALTALLGIGLGLVSSEAAAVEKESVIRQGKDSAAPGVFARPAPGPARGYRTLVGEGDSRLPVVVVRGTPYEMGRQLGELTAEPR